MSSTRRRPRRVLGAAGLAAALAAGLAAALATPPGWTGGTVHAQLPDGGLAVPRRHRPAPAFELTDLLHPGERIALASHLGRVVLVNLWASWCGPCVRELPLLVQLHRRYHARGLDILAVNVDEDAGVARAFLTRQAPALGLAAGATLPATLPFWVPWDPAGTVRAAYQPKVLPATFLIDTEGRLRYAHHGFGQGYLPRVPPRIESLLAGPPAPLAPLASAALAAAKLIDLARLAPKVLLDVRYATAANFTGAPLPGYHAARVLVRREAAEALARAAVRLQAQGFRLKVYDGYRPVRATAAMVAWARQSGRTDLLRDGYIAVDSQHNRGLAVDCTLTDASGRELSMGTAFDDFTPAAQVSAATGLAAENRARLRAALVAEGFQPYEREWWHFSLAVPDPLRFDVAVQ